MSVGSSTHASALGTLLPMKKPPSRPPLTISEITPTFSAALQVIHRRVDVPRELAFAGQPRNHRVAVDAAVQLPSADPIA